MNHLLACCLNPFPRCKVKGLTLTLTLCVGVKGSVEVRFICV